MKEKDIVKTLKKCTSKENCEGCEYIKYDTRCIVKLLKDALDLINRKQEEIEKLQKIQDDIDNFARDICKERMLKGKSIANFEDLQEYIRKEKSEAIKEFAERLKKRQVRICDCFEGVSIIDIDKLVKEMEG